MRSFTWLAITFVSSGSASPHRVPIPAGPGCAAPLPVASSPSDPGIVTSLATPTSDGAATSISLSSVVSFVTLTRATSTLLSVASSASSVVSNSASSILSSSTASSATIIIISSTSPTYPSSKVSSTTWNFSNGTTSILPSVIPTATSTSGNTVSSVFTSNVLPSATTVVSNSPSSVLSEPSSASSTFPSSISSATAAVSSSAISVPSSSIASSANSVISSSDSLTLLPSVASSTVSDASSVSSSLSSSVAPSATSIATSTFAPSVGTSASSITASSTMSSSAVSSDTSGTSSSAIPSSTIASISSTISATPSCPPRQLISNGRFENGLDPWVVQNWKAGGMIVNDGHDGSRGYMASSTERRDSFILRQPLHVPAGTVIDCSAWLTTERLRYTTNFEILIDGELCASRDIYGTDRSWSKFGGQIMASADTTEIQFRAFFEEGDTRLVTMRVSDFGIYAVSGPGLCGPSVSSSVSASVVSSIPSASSSAVESASSSAFSVSTSSPVLFSSATPIPSSSACIPPKATNFVQDPQFTQVSGSPWRYTGGNSMVSQGIVAGQGHGDGSYFKASSVPNADFGGFTVQQQVTIPSGTTVRCSAWFSTTTPEGHSAALTMRIDGVSCGSLDITDGPSDWKQLQGDEVTVRGDFHTVELYMSADIAFFGNADYGIDDASIVPACPTATTPQVPLSK